MAPFRQVSDGHELSSSDVFQLTSIMAPVVGVFFLCILLLRVKDVQQARKIKQIAEINIAKFETMEVHESPNCDFSGSVKSGSSVFKFTNWDFDLVKEALDRMEKFDGERQVLLNAKGKTGQTKVNGFGLSEEQERLKLELDRREKDRKRAGEGEAELFEMEF